jgi:hypothetical protein
MAGVNECGSPLLGQTHQDGNEVYKHCDLVEAWSIFFAKGLQFRVKAGVTVTGAATVDTLIPGAKKDLDAFLDGLVIAGP